MSKDNQMCEEKKYHAHPALFRNSPIRFIIAILIIPFFGIGLIALIIWYLQAINTTLTITNDKVTLRKGILSKHTNEVFLEDIRNVQIMQTFFQRIFKVGTIAVSTSAQSGVEIEVDGMKFPEKVKQIVDQARRANK